MTEEAIIGFEPDRLNRFEKHYYLDLADDFDGARRRFTVDRLVAKYLWDQQRIIREQAEEIARLRTRSSDIRQPR